ncbi:hypothetical protein ACFSTC_28120 [Nonomuraea ferruginea]
MTVHRAALVDLLRAAVPPEALRPGIDVQHVQPDGTVRHGGGTSTADLVVGADGVHSVTRRSLWPGLPGPRYVGYTTWRLIVPPSARRGERGNVGQGRTVRARADARRPHLLLRHGQRPGGLPCRPG